MSTPAPAANDSPSPAVAVPPPVALVTLKIFRALGVALLFVIPVALIWPDGGKTSPPSASAAQAVPARDSGDLLYARRGEGPSQYSVPDCEGREYVLSEETPGWTMEVKLPPGKWARVIIYGRRPFRVDV